MRDIQNIYRIILMTAGVIFITLLAGLIFFADGDDGDTPTSTPSALQYVETVELVEDIGWIDDTLYIRSGRHIHRLGDRIETLVEVDANTIIATDSRDNQLIYCSWDNITRESPEVDSTSVRLYDIAGLELRSFSINPTLTLLSCSADILIMQEQFHGSQERYYQYDTETLALTQLPDWRPTTTISGDLETTILHEEDEIMIDTFNNFSKAAVSRDGTSIALIDIDGRLWLYLVEQRPEPD